MIAHSPLLVDITMSLLGRFTVSDIIFYTELEPQVVYAIINDYHELLEQVGERADGFEYRLCSHPTIPRGTLASTWLSKAFESQRTRGGPRGIFDTPHDVNVFVVASLDGGAGIGQIVTELHYAIAIKYLRSYWKREICVLRERVSQIEQQSQQDAITFRDGCRGMLVLGTPGSGKTYGLGRLFADMCLRSDIGGLVISAKSDEITTWRRYVREHGRGDSLILFDENGRFNSTRLRTHSQDFSINSGFYDCLNADEGGLVITAKHGEVEGWPQCVRECGHGTSLMFFDRNERFNSTGLYRMETTNTLATNPVALVSASHAGFSINSEFYNMATSNTAVVNRTWFSSTEERRLPQELCSSPWSGFEQSNYNAGAFASGIIN